MEILEVRAAPIARDILGKTSGLMGHVKVKVNFVEMEFSLSRETIQTIEECVARDFDLKVKELACES
jgi:hypothetical protein